MSHLRVFDSQWFKHIPYATRKKLENKSKLVILINYHRIGAYKIYNLVVNKVEISRDVKVMEDE